MVFKSIVVVGTICIHLLFSSTLFAANDIDINAGNDLINISGSPLFVSTDDSAILGVDQITGVWSMNTSNSVSVSTSSVGADMQSGNISFSGSLDYDGSNYIGKTLNFSAHNNINISGSIFDSNDLQHNFLNLNLTPDSDTTGGGMAILSGSIDDVSVSVAGDLKVESTGIFRGALVADTVINEGQIFADNGGIDITNMTVGTGSANSGNLTIDDISSGVTVDGALTINAGGTVDIVNGGLYVDSIDNSAGGDFTYTQGVLYIFDDGVVIGNNGLLGNNVTITDNRHLGAYDLIVDNGANFNVTGGYNVFSGASVGTGFIINNGTMSISGGLLGTNSSFTNNSGATFNLNGGTLSVGSISNSGSFNFNAGTLNVNYSDLNVGDVANGSGHLMIDSSKFLDVDNNIIIGAGNTLTLAGGSVFANNIISGGGSLNFSLGHLGVDSLGISSGGLLGSNVTVNASKSLSANNINVASGSSLSVNDGALSVLNINNSGTIAIDNNGLNLGGGFGGTYTQNAGSTTVDGVLTADTVDIQGGTLKGSGVIVGNTIIGDGGILNAGNSPGSLNLDGGLTLTENGTLHFEIDDNTLSGFDYDQLIFNVNNPDSLLSVFEGGDILFDLFDGVEITDLTSSFDINDFFVASDGIVEFGLFQLLGYDTLANVSLLASDGEFNYILGLNELDGSFSVESVSSVPVPTAIWLFGSGLLGLVGVARRKRVA